MAIPKILRTIKTGKRFLITTHVNPDYDAVCSELAMAFYLRSLGKKVLIVNDEAVPERFSFLPGIRRVQGYRKKMSLNCDAAVVLDCGEFKRTGRVLSLIPKDAVVFNIDHHITNDFFGHFNLVDPGASSTTEILYTLFKRGRHPFTRDLALNLYMGMMTDTGSFRYENTSRRTHEAAGDLMRFGFSVPRLYTEVYETMRPDDFQRLIQLLNRAQLLCRGRLACLCLSRKTVSRFSRGLDLRDALFYFLRSIRGVEVFVLFTELDPRKTRVNLRSRAGADVARLAQHFGGGGHPRASGCTIPKGIAEARQDLLRHIRKVFKND